MSTTVAQLMAGSGLPTFEARALLAAVLALRREQLVARPELPVAAAQAARFTELVRRRIDGEPLAYLLGEREFYGRAFKVSPAVLVPRPETELLVEHALRWLRDRKAPRVLDLGCGSGCIAISIALERPDAQVVGVDRSAGALAMARANALALRAHVRWLESDWFSAVSDVFDLVVSNPPYIAAADPHLRALTHEPRDALTDGGDGLACLRSIVAGTPARLEQGGALLLEHGYDQGEAVRGLLAARGFDEVTTLTDLGGRDRAGWGRWRG